MAAKYLLEKGFSILHQNWRHGNWEVDFIASLNNTLHFIEVKTLNNTLFGHPEDSVTRKKFRFLQRAADEYLFRNPGHPWIQYNILSITMHKDGEVDYFFIEDVYL